MTVVKEEIIDLALTKDDVLRLSQYHHTACITIYIPTHRSGAATLNGEDSLSLKNQLKELRNKLSDNGMSSKQIEKLATPVLNLIDDADFWRHQSEGLAIFVSEEVFEKYTVPVSFEPFNYLSSAFYMLPLLPLFNDYGLFFLLTLKKDEVKFYEGNKYGLTEIDMTDAIPSRIEDAVGYDYEQKHLQYRTHRGNNRPGSFHGHGENETKERNELLIFFREIDRGIMSMLHEFQEPPLLVCCLDYNFHIYKEANTHKNLYPQHISLNPAGLDLKTLHEKAWEIIEPHFGQELDERREKYLIAVERGKSSSNIREIIPAAIQSKIDTLFIEKNTDIFGIYDPSTGGVTIQEGHNMANVSLMNLAGKKVFEKGGKVYILEKHEMPDGSSEMNALFRYQFNNGE